MTALLALGLASTVCFRPFKTCAAPPVRHSCITSLPPETASHRVARHRKIAERRKGPVVMVHRGAAAFAPENTLEAYAAAMDYGADGCEIDLRRTADGVLVLSHDATLDRCWNGLGRIGEYTYRQLLQFKPRQVYGTATQQTRIPTFAAVIELARQRAMLLHLDIKEPGLEDQIIRLLDAGDAWDHVVAVNRYNSDKILKNPKLRLLAFKAPGLDGERLDLDPPAVRAALAKPGNMIQVDDPRVAVHELKRPAFEPVPLPQAVFGPRPPKPAVAVHETNVLVSVRTAVQGIDPNSRPALESLLADYPERAQPNGNATYQRRRRARLLRRSWAAKRLGDLDDRSGRTKRLLENVLLTRSLDNDWNYHGLDGIMATRALVELGATDSVPVLRRVLFLKDPALKRISNPVFHDYPTTWPDYRVKSEIVSALGALPCLASKQALFSYLALDQKSAHELAPPLHKEVAAALAHQSLTLPQVESLLRSPDSSVRGEIVLACLDHPTKLRTAALKSAAPWALHLPRASR